MPGLDYEDEDIRVVKYQKSLWLSVALAVVAAAWLPSLTWVSNYGSLKQTVENNTNGIDRLNSLLPKIIETKAQVDSLLQQNAEFSRKLDQLIMFHMQSNSLNSGLLFQKGNAAIVAVMARHDGTSAPQSQN